MSSDEEYKFQLVAFVESQKQGLLDIDVVPTTWVSWNVKQQACVIPYPSPPYTAKTLMQLQRFVQEEKSPPQNWPLWEILIKGGADTYDAALVRLDKLKTAAYAYTTDAEGDGQKKASAATEKIKKQSLKELFDVPKLGNDDDEAWQSADESSSEKSSSSSSSKTPVKKKSKNPKATRKILKGKLQNRKISDVALGRSKPTKKRDRVVNSVRTTNESIVTRTISSSPKDNPLILATVESDNNSVETRPEKSGSPARSVASSARSCLSFTADENGNKHCNQSVQQRADIIEKSATARERQEEIIDGGKGLSRDTLFLLKVIKGMCSQLQDNTAAINALHDCLKDKGIIGTQKLTVVQFETEYNLTLPFETLEQFQEFDKNLQEDKAFNQRLGLSLKQLLDRQNNVTKSVTTILRTFFTKEVITRFTATKKVEGKTLLKETSFGICLLDVLIGFHTESDGTPIKKAEALKFAGNAISNAKDWDGRRRPPKEI